MGDGQNLTARDTLLLNALANSTGVYFNYSSQYPCTNLSDWEGDGGLDAQGWNVLACNQLAMPIGYGNDSMFLPEHFDFDTYQTTCQDTYSLTPYWNWALDQFRGWN